MSTRTSEAAPDLGIAFESTSRLMSQTPVFPIQRRPRTAASRARTHIVVTTKPERRKRSQHPEVPRAAAHH